MGPMSVAKTLAVLYAIIGFIAGGFISLFSMVGAAFAESAGSALGPLFGVAAIIALPIFYGLFGFIGGLIMAAVYNVVASMTGGIEFEIAPKV